MAMCDSSYKFTYVDVGTSGRWSDGGTFDNCSLNQTVSDGTLSIPGDFPLPGLLFSTQLKTLESFFFVSICWYFSYSMHQLIQVRMVLVCLM